MKSVRIRLKTPDDIQRIRDAGSIIAEVFRNLSSLSLEGLSTWDVDSIIEAIIIKHKGRPAFKTVPRYSAASCISINNEVVHAIPSKKKRINSGDLVKIDTGVVLHGYFSDACRTYCIGVVSDNAKRLTDATRDALRSAISVMKVGKKIGDIGHAIQQCASGKGYSVVRNYFGHGVGFSLHEPPVVPHFGKPGTGVTLKPGMVLAVEPMINEGGPEVLLSSDKWTAVTADGGLSAHFEHTIAVTEDGPVILTE